MNNPLINIDDWSGGMTLNPKKGTTNQFHTGYGVDFSSREGCIAPGYAWTNIVFSTSESVPCEFNWTVGTAKDGTIYFGGNDTKIYKPSDMGTIVLAHDDANTGGITGMCEYKDYLVWMSSTIMGTYDFSSTWVDSFKTGFTTDYWHPMFVSADGNCYIGHGKYVGKLTDPTDNATVTLYALNLPAGWSVRCLCDFGYLYLAVGANYLNSSNDPIQSKIVFWDRTSDTWQDEIVIPEKDIKAMCFESGYLWVWAGRSCNLYVVPEGSRKATKMLSFKKEDPTAVFDIYPGAVLTRNGTIYFGLSGVDSVSDDFNPSAIYSFPADPNSFSLNIVKMDSGYKERYKSLGLKKGAEADGGDIIYAGWRNFVTGGAEYNRLSRENISTADATYNTQGSCESFRYSAPANKRMKIDVFGVEFEPLASGMDLNLYYGKDGASPTTAVFESFSTAGATEKIIYTKGIIAKDLKLKLLLRGSTSTSSRIRPFVKRIWVSGTLISRQ